MNETYVIGISHNILIEVFYLNMNIIRLEIIFEYLKNHKQLNIGIFEI